MNRRLAFTTTTTAQPFIRSSNAQVISSRSFYVGHKQPHYHVARRPRYVTTVMMNTDPMLSSMQNVAASFVSQYHHPSSLIAMPLHSLAANEKLYADIIKGSFAIIFATLVSVVIVGLIVRTNLDKVRSLFFFFFVGFHSVLFFYFFLAFFSFLYLFFCFQNQKKEKIVSKD